MDVHVESRRSERAAASRGDGESGFLATGQEVGGEFRCSGCGYGVVVRSVLPSCPMCRGLVWEEPAGSPFSF